MHFQFWVGKSERGEAQEIEAGDFYANLWFQLKREEENFREVGGERE